MFHTQDPQTLFTAVRNSVTQDLCTPAHDTHTRRIVSQFPAAARDVSLPQGVHTQSLEPPPPASYSMGNGGAFPGIKSA
jgi:hypothetical protein